MPRRIDVEYEMLQVRRKVQQKIDRMALEAEARVYGMTPIGYAMQIENIRRERQEAEKQRQLEQTRRNAEALGRTLRDLHDSFRAIGEGLSKGFNGG